jgi:hypothetical protein
MNRIEPKDLVVGQLALYVEYMGDSKPPECTLVKVLTVEPALTAKKVLSGETFEPFPIYTYFESVHPQYVELRLKALRAERERLDAEITAFETL